MNLEGGCSCAALRYKLTASPLIVHACHCRDCQRVTGSGFVINIWIEKLFVETNGAIPKSFMLKGGSGRNHEVSFATNAAPTYGVAITVRLATPCSFVPGRSMSRKRSSPTFISLRGASCHGWIFQRACQLSNRSIASRKSGQPRARSGCVATAPARPEAVRGISTARHRFGGSRVARAPHSKALRPVMSRPSTSVCTSKAPSYVFTVSRFSM